MVRYTQRAWFTPIGFMSQNLLGYPMMYFLGIPMLVYPFRYQISDYWERCSQDPGDVLKTKAMLYYMEMESVGQRNAFFFGPTRKDSGTNANGDMRQVGDEIKKGTPGMDEEYFRVHYADAARVKAMQDEIASLKKAMASESH